MKAEGQSSEKKKAMILIALFVVLGAAGVFQLMPGGQEPPATKKQPYKPADPAAQVDLPKNPSVAYNLPERDPFAGPEPDVKAKPNAKYVEPDNSKRPVQPPGLGGTLPAPGPNHPGTPDGKGSMSVQDGPPFAYALSGLLLGDRPIAVFRDSQGHERMIRLGGSIDPEAQLTSIDKTGVTVKYRGETLHLKIGGTSVAK